MFKDMFSSRTVSVVMTRWVNDQLVALTTLKLLNPPVVSGPKMTRNCIQQLRKHLTCCFFHFTFYDLS